jgi:hypothetical protein
MIRIFLFIFLLSLLPYRGIAQCNVNEVQVKVEIETDNWGYETYWTLSNLMGTVVLQGGQGGVYGNFSSYSDSICVPANGCFTFEIYDTFGDGIYTPGGYWVYVNGALVSTGSNNINAYATASVNCWDSCGITLNALTSLEQHILGMATLTSNELITVRNIFAQFPECLAQSQAVIVLGKNTVANYEAQSGALFTTPSTQNGFSKDPTVSPGLNLQRAMIALQQGILDEVFSPQVYTNYPQHINGWKFNSCFNFPGYVSPPLDSSLTISVPIRANFADPSGKNPYFNINGDGTDHALRPTGMYLAPGSVATIAVPASLVGQGYYVRVGSHEWDLSIKGDYVRFDRISKKFPIDSTTIKVFNPFGGAISILVPYGADEGIVNVSVQNGVQAPFFSLKSFYVTPNFNAELSKPGPWAVFETDNVMFTIPKHSIISGQYDLLQALLDWDTAIRGINSILARQIIPDKHDMYMIADRTIRHHAYSIGYPMSNTPLDYTNVPGPAYFINGPGPDDETNFHEHGHALAMSKFAGEEEALVNFPYVMAMNYGLGEDLNEAVKYSFVPNTFDIDKTAAYRMLSNTFGTARDISNTTTDEVRYQHRGYGHYNEIVNIFGWCPLRNFWKQEHIDFTNGIDHGTNDQDNDSRIIRMSIAAQADLRPLFHVFGIVPQNNATIQNVLNQNGILPSLEIYNRLQAYFNLIPQSNAAFVSYALSVYPNLYTDGPTDDPNYGVGWHYQKSLTYNTAEAQSRTAILQSIIDLYYPNGMPTGGATPDLCCLLDTVHISLINGNVTVTGGVEPYNISMDTTGNMVTATVVDFDGCESIIQFTTSGLPEQDAEEIIIYPNPASTEIYFDLTGGSGQIERLQFISINGQVIKHYEKPEYVIDVSTFSEGVYILQMELVGGTKINTRLMILR